MTKADVIQQERYSRSKVPMNEIESNAKTLRPMSEITDAQAELVHMMCMMVATQQKQVKG